MNRPSDAAGGHAATPSGWREEVLSFGAQGTQRGVLCMPTASPAGGAAVLFINAGLIHHVGPNRLHVQLARALATAGLASLRLDLSGLGDSGVRGDNLPIFDLVRREPVEAMDALAAHGYTRFALVGLCSGAYSAFHVACADPRVAAAVMINPEDLQVGGSPGAQAWARRYWTRSILRPRAWLNLLTGRSDVGRLWATLRSQLGRRSAPAAPTDGLHPVLAELRAAVQSRPLQLLFLTSADDVSTEYMGALLGGKALRGVPAGAVEHRVVPQCEHLFTRLQDQRRLRELLLPWMRARMGGGAATG
jgi:hypothetical protein